MGASSDALSTLFERAPRFVARVADESAAASLAELLEGAERMAINLPEEEQVELLNGHPRIGADPATVSAHSFREQGYDRDPAARDTRLAERLARLNAAYEDQFGFRFVVFVAGRSRSEIADFLEGRLSADRKEELHRALHDVFAIARDRLAKMKLTQEA